MTSSAREWPCAVGWRTVFAPSDEDAGRSRPPREARELRIEDVVPRAGALCTGGVLQGTRGRRNVVKSSYERVLLGALVAAMSAAALGYTVGDPPTMPAPVWKLPVGRGWGCTC